MFVAAAISLLVAAMWAPGARGSSPSPSSSLTPAVSSSPTFSPLPSGTSGAQVFASVCAACHGAQGQGLNCPSLKADGFDYLVAQKVEMGGRGMPAFGRLLSPAQIQGVSSYVATDIADPQARLATIGEGGQIFRLYCAGCHGAAGRGGAIGRGRNAPSYANLPAADALAAMIYGPFNMPVFTSTLTIREQAAVARYVYELKSSAISPGGYGLGYAGPVAEGAMAAAGIVALVLVGVWLASRMRGARHG
jgi:ubiquinol-cytochrome c reductase cytochrome c subunit